MRFSLNSFKFFFMDSSNKLIISIANNPAFCPPLIATVATGIQRAFERLIKRVNPLKCLTLYWYSNYRNASYGCQHSWKMSSTPAPAIITFMFSDSAFFAYSIISIGVRWAESIQTSVFIPNSLKISMAGFNVLDLNHYPLRQQFYKYL